MKRRLRNALVAAALLAASVGIASGTPAHAAKGMEIALQDDNALVSERGLKRSNSAEAK